MIEAAGTLPSRRTRLVLGALAVLPFLVWIAFRFTGHASLLRLAAMGLAGAAVLAAVFVRPRLGLYFVVFWVYSGIGLHFPADVAPPIVAITFASVLLSLMRGEENRLTDPVFWYSAALFALIGLQSGLVARDPSLTLFELFSFCKILLVIGVVVQLVHTPEQIRTMAYVAFAGAVSTVLIGVMAIPAGLAEGNVSFIGGVGMLRFAGAQGDPNRAASILCSALPLGLFAMGMSRGVYRIASVIGVVVLIVAMFSTFSRAAVFPFGVLLIAFVIREVRSRRSFFALILLMSLGILLTPRYYWDRVFGLSQALKDATLDWSVYTRVLAAKTSWEMFLHHPLTGVGLGNFIESSAYRLFVRIVAHNTYLEILVGVGIFGMLAFLSMIGSGFRHMWAGARTRWERSPRWMQPLSFYFALCLVSICLSGVFLSFPFRYPLWLPVAAGLAIGNLRRRETGGGRTA